MSQALVGQKLVSVQGVGTGAEGGRYVSHGGRLQGLSDWPTIATDTLERLDIWSLRHFVNPPHLSLIIRMFSFSN